MKNYYLFFLTAVFSLYAINTNAQSENSKSKTMKKATPFKIEIPQTVLDDLQDRLAKTRWTDEPQNAGWNNGINPGFLRELVAYWQTKFDWRKQEAMLNQHPQFKVGIDGINIHFVYVKGKGKNPKPLILTHGWPDCFYRYYKVILMLTDPASYGGNPDESFDVIIPSMPGFGFSDHVGMNGDQVAALWQKLMKDVLGYDAYYAAGGDMSTYVTKSLANQFPENVKGIYLTDIGYPTGMEDQSSYSPAEKDFAQRAQRWWYMEGAYNMLQSTKPQTLGYGLNDSPTGLAAWILEKFNSWSDNKGNIENSFTKDELLTDIMIYWTTQTINSSFQMYRATTIAAFTGKPKWNEYVKVPTGIGVFPGHVPFPEEWAKRQANVRHFTLMPKGGHFDAMEEPELYAKDITQFIYAH